MVDNIAVTAGTGTTIAADDIAGVLHQRVKISQGADGSATDVSSAAPLEVTLANGTVPSHAVTNAGTFAVQSTIAAAIPAGNNNIGDVDVASIAAGDNNIGNVDLASAIPAGTAYIGKTRLTDGTNDISLVDAAVSASAFAVPVAIHPDSVNANGRTTPANSAPVVAASQTYETVAASQTAQVLGASGATGDYIDSILVIPATTSPGNVLLLDNATSITVFTGGASSVSNLVPFTISIGAISASGAWKITTGANVSVIGIGNFS